MSVPWVEKYRPKTIDQVASQEEVVQVLSASCQENLPHLLFYGPPGTGKTSTILAFAKQLLGSEAHNNILELNASDERGISVIREKVKNFAKTAISNVPFKIIILDEADSMTNDAQTALRRTMETYSKVTRFCLICNYVSRIIDPLASRCAKFRFKPLSKSSVLDRLGYIASQESVMIDNDALNVIVDFCEGDLRKCITLLQSAHRLSQGTKAITKQNVLEMTGSLPDPLVDQVLKVWESNDVAKIQNFCQELVLNGYSVGQLLVQLQDRLLLDTHLSDKSKSRMAMAMAKVERCLVDGADEQLQLLSMLVQPI